MTCRPFAYWRAVGMGRVGRRTGGRATPSLARSRGVSTPSPSFLEGRRRATDVGASSASDSAPDVMD